MTPLYTVEDYGEWIDAELALLTLASVVVFAIAIAKKYHRSSILYDPADEEFAHSIALTIPTFLFAISLHFGRLTFATLGIGIFTSILVYHSLGLLENENKKIDIAVVLTMFVAVVTVCYIILQ